MEWRNIKKEEPPKNEEIIVYFSCSNIVEREAFIDKDKLVKVTRNGETHYDWNYEPCVHTKKTATHWMPLPEPPTE